MQFPRLIEAVIIDLDGTLVDTVPDIAEAANRMLAGLNLPRRPETEIASFVGKGIRNLVARCIVSTDAGRLDAATAVFERHYADTSGTLSRVYPGVREGLDALHRLRLPLACVTNKAASFTGPLLEHFGMIDDFKLVVSGDTLEKKKPDPAPVLHVCRQFGVAPQATLSIGDSPNDTQAARAAGCPVVCVPYGYREGLEVRELDCDAIVSSLEAAAELVQSSNSANAPGHSIRQA
jgi:phosphoglycolate phosphatase